MLVVLALGVCLANGWPAGITTLLPLVEPRYTILAMMLLAIILGLMDHVHTTKLKNQVISANGNICPKCHYPTHVAPGARCPECGTVYSEAMVLRWRKWMNTRS